MTAARPRLRSILSVLTLTGALHSACAAEVDAALTVVAVAGSAEVERLGERHRLQLGEVLSERDVLYLDDDGHLALQLAQSGVLELGPHAELSVEKLPSGTSLKNRKSIFNLTRGYLRVAWAAPADAATPLFLYFSGQRASLENGEYFFESEPADARVCVASGKLLARPIAGSTPHTLLPAACYRLVNGAEPESIARDAATWAGMRRNFSLNAPTSPEAELAAADPSAHAIAGTPGPMPETPSESPSTPSSEPSARVEHLPAPVAALSAEPPRTTNPPVHADEPTPRPATLPPAIKAKPDVPVSNGRWAINIASYPERAVADRQAMDLHGAGYKAAVQAIQIEGRTWFRVQLRGFNASESAQAQLQTLRAKPGYASAWVVRVP